MASPMTSREARTLNLRPEVVADLFKPARLEIFESLQMSGPSSIAQLAERIGRPADSLYYHVKKLLETGVIEAADEMTGEGNPGRNGAVYSVAANTVVMELDLSSRRSREAWASGAAAVLRLAERGVRAAIDAGDVCTEGEGRDLFVHRSKARLSDSELKRLNGHLDAIHTLLSDRVGRTQGRFYAVTSVLTSLEERPQ